jgi:hypothetical protein
MPAKVAKVKSFERDGVEENVIIDPGGGANRTAEHTAPGGVDAPPLPGDEVVAVECGGKGTQQAVGYRDPTNTREASPGEHRFYARNAAGEVVATVWLKGDGRIVLENDVSTWSTSHDGSSGSTHIDDDEVLLGRSPGAPVARRGELVATVTPKLICGAPGTPCIPVPPTALTPTGNYTGTGVVISGANTVKAGP